MTTAPIIGFFVDQLGMPPRWVGESSPCSFSQACMHSDTVGWLQHARDWHREVSGLATENRKPLIEAWAEMIERVTPGLRSIATIKSLIVTIKQMARASMMWGGRSDVGTRVGSTVEFPIDPDHKDEIDKMGWDRRMWTLIAAAVVVYLVAKGGE